MYTSRRPITACVDHSDETPGVVRWAATEAVLRGAELRLVTVVEDNNPSMSSWQLTPEYFAEMRELAETLLHRCVAVARDTTGGEGTAPLAVHTSLIHGPVRGALINESEQSQLVVLGAERRGVVSNVGSVIAALSAHSLCPVALVGNPPTEPTRRRTIVVGVDGSQNSTQALEAGFAEADLRGTTLTAVHAWRRHHTQSAYVAGGKVDIAMHREGEKAVLGQRLAGHRDQYPDLEVISMVEEGDPVDVLTGASHNAEVMFVGSRGRGGFSGMLLGSTSSRLLAMPTCPLVIVRHDADEPPHGLRHALRRVAQRV